MGLRQQKVRPKPGPPELLTVALVVLAVAAMLAGPLLMPGVDWQQASGTASDVYRYQHPTNPDGRPHRVRLNYTFKVNGIAYAGQWDGDWPETHSPNALPDGQLDRLAEAGYLLVVFYDPADPAHNALHKTGSGAGVWWLRLSVALAALVLWYVFVVYPRLKQSGGNP